MNRSTYSDAEVRGRMRAWKQQLAERYEPIRRAPREDWMLALAAEFAFRGTVKGRGRALKRIRRRVEPAAQPMASRTTGAAPYALWRTLSPQLSMFEDKAIRDKPFLQQDCVVVGYLAVTREEVVHGELWGLIVPDHAIGRAIARSGQRSPQRIIEDAHSNLLKVRVEAVVPYGRINPERRFYLRAGDGVFVCFIDSSPVEGGEGGTRERPFVFAQTWISEEMRQANQHPLAEDGRPGEQLGESWLLPRPMLGLDRSLEQARTLYEIGLRHPTDMRRDISSAEVGEMLAKMAAADFVWCEYPDGSRGRLIKGDEICDRINAGEPPPAASARVMWLRVANACQVAILEDALRHSEDEEERRSDSMVALMLSVAATVPPGQNDHILFRAAMERITKD